MCRLTELHPSQPTANCASEASELTGTCPVPSPVTGLPARHGAIPLREDRLTQPTQRRIRYAHAGPCTHRVSVLHCPCLGLPPPCPTSPNPTRPPPLTRAALRSCQCHPPPSSCRAAPSPRPLLRSGWRPPSPARRRPSAARARPGPRLPPRRQLEPPEVRAARIRPARRFFGVVVLERFRFGSRGKERFFGPFLLLIPPGVVDLMETGSFFRRKFGGICVEGRRFRLFP